MRQIARLVVAGAIGMCGCGTADNLHDPGGKPTVYGGVARDLRMDMLTDFRAADSSAAATFSSTATVVLMCLADLPLSAVLDTLTLPITIRAALAKDGPNREELSLGQPATPAVPKAAAQ